MPKKGYKQTEEHKQKVKKVLLGLLKPNSGSFQEGHLRTPNGKDHWNYRGGKYKFQGYWMILRSDGKGYIKNHILVAETKLGRPLSGEEVVHHINGLRYDDRPENLWIFPNNKSHGIYEGNLHRTYKKWIQQDYNLT